MVAVFHYLGTSCRKNVVFLTQGKNSHLSEADRCEFFLEFDGGGEKKEEGAESSADGLCKIIESDGLCKTMQSNGLCKILEGRRFWGSNRPFVSVVVL